MRKKCSHCKIDGHNSRTCQNHGVRIFGTRLTPSDHCPSITTERKKAVQWSEEEHKMFLIGLKKLGKGDWCGISRNYVFTRTPTQVASHAQKYFLRHSAHNARNRRTSVFDIVPHGELQQVTGSSSTSVAPQLSEQRPVMQNNSSTVMEPVISDRPANPTCYCPAFFSSKLYSYGFLQPHPMPYWPSYSAQQSPHEIIKPLVGCLESPNDDLPRLSL